MSVSSVDWLAVNVQECATQRQYMRHRFLRSVQKQAPWLAIASIITVFLTFPFITFPDEYGLCIALSLGYIIFIIVSLRTMLETWRETRFSKIVTTSVLLLFLSEIFLVIGNHRHIDVNITNTTFASVLNNDQLLTDLLMAFLVMLASILCHIQWSKCSQALLCVVIMMPVNGLLASLYGIQDAYGQLSMLASMGGLLCAAALLAKQISQTSMSYLLLLDDSGKHLRWIICILFLCAITLGGVGVYFKHDPRVTPMIITLALISIVSIMTITYYRKGVMHEKVLPPEDLAFASELEAAIAHEEFYLVFQPQIEFNTGKLVGVEALIRWQHPQHGVVPPNRFIGVAELTGLIVPMGAWVLKAACQQVSGWKDNELINAKVSVNVSPMQLNAEGFIDYVVQVLHETGLDAERLVIELTESAFVHSDCRSMENLLALKRTGVKLAIDDFGTGFSCLAYLKDIPGDYLKVDRSFVNDVPGKERSEAVTSAIVVLGKNLHYQIVAEGVETEAQANYLKGLGCDFVQGFLYAKPMTGLALQDWVQVRAHAK
ncbi:MAG TPA: EAL domain-containing protein [Methylophilus sp.]|uniref:EAL domain-containing protein n=1 Tax=Methylophilus sp. TaxID=29541 RepID=UPI002B78BA50|nr:EAL domain-containing protein [Methylophilus sp.]HSH85647.1 EAL domain-containing protein [Methylophilus sp.]